EQSRCQPDPGGSGAVLTRTKHGSAAGRNAARSARRCELHAASRTRLHGARRTFAGCHLAGLLVGALALAGAGPVAAAPASPLLPGLDHPPLDPPLRLSGDFGEFRSNHLHAGLDLSTDEQIGRPAYASLAGRIERVRTSGVGYGRSVYLR